MVLKSLAYIFSMLTKSKKKRRSGHRSGDDRSGDGSLIRPELRKETTKQNHKRVMRSGSWIQTTGPNNGHQLRDYSKSSNRSENRPPDLKGWLVFYLFKVLLVEP